MIYKFAGINIGSMNRSVMMLYGRIWFYLNVVMFLHLGYILGCNLLSVVLRSIVLL